jgi:hypothetical protein
VSSGHQGKEIIVAGEDIYWIPAERITTAIARYSFRDLRDMAALIGNADSLNLITSLKEELITALRAIGCLILDGKIIPQCGLRLSEYAPIISPYAKPLRVGIFAISADPLHWMHLLTGLKAMAHFGLDKIIYVISGNDPRKPNLLRADIRHRIAQDTLRLFAPLFAYSPIAMNSVSDGEVNIFRLLQLNQLQRIEAFYIAGMDHYNRSDPATDKPDTIDKLESGIKARVFDYDLAMHPISALFIGRGGRTLPPINTFLDIEFISGTQYETSSTAIRKALAGRAPLENLAALPYSAFREIMANGLYESSSTKFHEAETEPLEDIGVKERQVATFLSSDRTFT